MTLILYEKLKMQYTRETKLRKQIDDVEQNFMH